MSSRSYRRKRAARRTAERKVETLPGAPANSPEAPALVPEPAGRAERPTAEQLARGAYRYPEGPERQFRPVVNIAPDCVAALMIPPARLTPIQHDAARDWQDMRQSVIAGLGLNGGRSCLDTTPGGSDGDDGDLGLADHWRRIRATLGPIRIAILDRTCLDGAWPADIDALRAALSAYAKLAERA